MDILDDSQISAWGRWCQAQRRRERGRCIRCGVAIEGYPGKLRCHPCKLLASQERRKARRKIGNLAHQR